VTRTPTNIAASVSAKLLARSRASGENHQFLLQRYAAERFLYRLGESTQRERFVLKGAMLFGLWGGSTYRPTRDLDFCGYGDRETASVLESIRDICAVVVADDGISFDLSDVEAGPIRDDAEYGGIRLRFFARLDSARIPVQIDIGFGDAITPGPTDENYPTLLEGSSRPRIRAYPREAVIAEKLHAMVELGDRNSRFKDFYDLYILASTFSFDGRQVSAAIAATFKRRGRSIDSALPTALSPAFYEDASRAGLWRAYLTRNTLTGAPADFGEIYIRLSRFLVPVWSALAVKSAFESKWSPGGPWENA